MSQRVTRILLVVGLVILLLFGFVVWWSNDNYYTFSGGNKGCDGQIPIYVQEGFSTNVECGILEKDEMGGDNYLGILREVRNIEDNYFMAVDFLNKTDWYYLGEGDGEGMVYVGLGSNNQQSTDTQSIPQYKNFKLDEEGIKDFNRYEGSYIGINVPSDNQIKEWLDIPFDEIKSGISKEQYEAFIGYWKKCYENSNLSLTRWFNFCKPYITGLEIYDQKD